MISAIITTIGRESLGKAVESVLKQTYKDFELIIVNDNPNKPVWFNDKRIRIINNEKNIGGAKSLNVGLDASKGEYIAILDDDDEWISEDKLELQVDAMKKGYVAVGTEIEGSRSPGTISLEGTPFAHSSIMFRNNGIRYNEKLPRAKDLDLMLRLAQMGKMSIIRDCFIRYTARKGIAGLKGKIIDCSWHRKVIWMHRKDFELWFVVYWKVLKRQLKLLYYDKVKNIIVNRFFPRKSREGVKT
jgi:glycosyltransferase involved in cell wall biosynthesis